MACRATDDAATAPTARDRRPKTRQRRRRDAGSPMTAPHHHTARNPTVLSLSPVLSEPGPDAVRMTPKSKKKPPTSIIPGHDPRRYRDDGVGVESIVKFDFHTVADSKGGAIDRDVALGHDARE